MSANAAHFDDNQVPSMMGVIGTLGTADTGGTAAPLPVSINPATGAVYTQDIVPGTIAVGTITRVSTIGTLEVGTMTNTGTNVNVVTGTVTRVSTIGTLEVGTMTNTGTNVNVVTGTVTSVSNLATGTLSALAAGTITGGTLQNLVGGTINALASGTITGGTLGNLTSGTINALASGTITGGTIQNIVSGTINSGTIVGNGGSIGVQGVGGTGVAAVGNPVLVGGVDGGGTTYRMLVDTAGNPQVDVVNLGTLATGTLQNLVSGTLNALASGTIAGGTLQNLVSGTINALASGTITGGTLQNLVGGTINAIASGTMSGGTLQNLVSGTINALAAGTITAGTINAGTVQINSLPVTIGTSYGTLGTAGVATWGTLVAAAGAGTYQYVSGLSVVVASGTVDCAITNVGTVATIGGAGILTRGQFTPGGGIMMPFIPATRSGTNGTLSFWMGGAGSAYFTVNYWQGV